MAERQYTDEEVAAIFANASSDQDATLHAPSGSNGLTLAALHEIGREVGLSAESISQAARTLDQGGRLASRTFIGLPIGVGRTVDLGRSLTTGEWECLVTDLRETFQARGRLRYDGSFRQWTNGNLQALLEPTAAGFRLRMQTMNARARTLIIFGAAALAISGASLIASVVTGTANTPGLLLLAGFGVGSIVIAGVTVRTWARLRASQMASVASRHADTMTRQVPPSTENTKP